MSQVHDGAARHSARRRGFDAHLPPALAELRRSVDELLETFWDDGCQRRVREQAAALAQAARLEGLSRMWILARSTASICLMGRVDALEIEREVKEKLTDLMDELEEISAQAPGRETG
jgi:hypothetical protein